MMKAFKNCHRTEECIELGGLQNVTDPGSTLHDPSIDAKYDRVKADGLVDVNDFIKGSSSLWEQMESIVSTLPRSVDAATLQTQTFKCKVVDQYATLKCKRGFL